jgi:hypothetical protein
MNDASIQCPAIASSAVVLGEEYPAKYRDCQRLALGQFWQDPKALPAEGASAYIGAAAEGLCFYGRLQDSDIFSTATADNQKMWTLGDTLEVFVKPGTERTDYWEIHVTPNDFIMDIHIPDRERFTGGEVTWQDVIAPNSHSKKRVAVLDGVWAVELCIPWAAFDLKGIPAAGTTWLFAVCRYNYNGGLDNPEHSSTASFTEPGFHQYEEYTHLVF